MSQQQHGGNVADKHPTSILDLPNELVFLIHNHLQDIEDLLNLASTCRHFRNSPAKTPPQIVFRLLVGSARLGCWSPHPDYLVSGVASQIGRWAMQSDGNARIFEKYCRRGMWGLLDLALGPANCGLTLKAAKNLRETREYHMHPVIDLIDKCVGTQWNTTPDFWHGGVSDAFTIVACSTMTYFQLCLYGELFRPALESFILHDKIPLYAQPEIRLTAVRGLFSDRPFESTDEPVVLQYKDGSETRLCFCDLPQPVNEPIWKERSDYDRFDGGDRMTDSILAIRHLLYKNKFTEAFEKFSEDLGAASGTDTIEDTVYYNRQSELKEDALWVSCLLLSGNEGMKHFGRSIQCEKPGIDKDWADSMRRLWSVLKEERCRSKLSKDFVNAVPRWLGHIHRTSLWPDLLGDMNIFFQAE